MATDQTPSDTEITENLITKYQLEPYFSTRFADVGYSRDKGIIMCVLKEAYIPIARFKETFNEIEKLAAEGGFSKFIFDKRSLRAFHQPSMEWYFIEWKKTVYQYGIDKHRKILPAEEWFSKMVEIAKHQILEKYPDNIVHLLDIQYCNSIEEALAT